MSHVVLNEMDKTGGPEYRVGDLFRYLDNTCILLRLGTVEDWWYMVPILGEKDAFNCGWEWNKKTLEAQIRGGFAVRLPKGSSITITQE